MPFERIAFNKLKCHVRLEDLRASDFVTRRCMFCGWREIIAPWQIYAAHPGSMSLRTYFGDRPCPKCGFEGVIWGCVRARDR